GDRRVGRTEVRTQEELKGRRVWRRPGWVRYRKTKIRTRTAASSCAIRQTVVVHESPVAAYAPRNRAKVTKNPPAPIKTVAAMIIEVAPPPPPATARVEIATTPVRRESRPKTSSVMCWDGDLPMAQSFSPIPIIVTPHPKMVVEPARTSNSATNATINKNR